VLGLLPLILGVVLLLWTVRDFYVAGRGTLAPWSPPEELVVVGLYRISRNPMYIAVIFVLVGWAIGFQSPLLGIYAVVIAVGFHLRVMFGEEPWLARVHGEKWRLYKEQVPRWLSFRSGAFRAMPTHLSDQMFRLFPELRELSSEGDEDLPYVLMLNLVGLLESQASPSLSPATIARLLEFNSWCHNQPRGVDAGNDVFTILVVGLYEKLIESDKLRYLIPKLISESDFANAKDYLVRWVGQENYDRAMALYSSGAAVVQP
jgi:hypothetical protein